MKSWHEVESFYRHYITDLLIKERERLIELANRPVGPYVGGLVEALEAAEALDIAVRVLEAVARKGERLASGQSVEIRGELRMAGK